MRHFKPGRPVTYRSANTPRRIRTNITKDSGIYSFPLPYLKKNSLTLAVFKNIYTFATHLTNAQMAESVDALVSNTSGFTSMPVRSRLWVLPRNANSFIYKELAFFFFSPCPQRVRLLKKMGVSGFSRLATFQLRKMKEVKHYYNQGVQARVGI